MIAAKKARTRRVMNRPARPAHEIDKVFRELKESLDNLTQFCGRDESAELLLDYLYRLHPTATKEMLFQRAGEVANQIHLHSQVARDLLRQLHCNIFRVM